MRLWCCLMLAAIAAPAYADPSPPYYGPMKAGPGFVLKFKYGFKDGVEKDGTWRVDAATRRGEAIDIAMYRVAERAREQGYAFVEFQGGLGSRSPGIDSATVYARPSHSPTAPATCRSRRRNACYTADVAEVLRILGGPGGTQPGVPVTDHLDEYGRAVSFSGYGVGAASAAARRVPPIAPVATAVAAPVAVSVVAVPPPVWARIAAARAPQPAPSVRRAAASRGWSISD